MTINCYWTLADNTLHFLEFPDGGSAEVSPAKQAISSDGTIIIGIVFDGLGNVIPAMWVSGVLHELPIPESVTSTLVARIVSPNGAVIAGTSTDGDVVMWTSGGTVATVLPQIPNSSIVNSSVDCTSDDGSIICGTNIDTIASARVAVYWTNGTGPTALPNARANSSAFVHDCNSTGTIIIGSTFSVSGDEFFFPVYWASGVERDLTTGIWGGGVAGQVTADGTIMRDEPDGGIVGPFPGENDQYYWSSVGSSSGGFYGTLHQYSLLGGFTTLGIADLAKGLNVSVGVAYTDNGVDNVGVRWTGITPAMLSTSLTVAVPMRGVGVSSDGTIVAGNANTLDFSFQRAGYWDALGDWTTLQVLNEMDNTGAEDVCRSGAVVYGIAAPVTGTNVDLTGISATAEIGVPVAKLLPRLQMDNLVISQFPADTTDRDVTLRWSDDAGASWSNGTLQSLGNLGQYDVNIQFRRLGHARTRVWEITWSSPVITAMTGAWLQTEVART